MESWKRYVLAGNDRSDRLDRGMLCARKKVRGPPEPGRRQHHRHIMPRSMCSEAWLWCIIHQLSNHRWAGPSPARAVCCASRPAMPLKVLWLGPHCRHSVTGSSCAYRRLQAGWQVAGKRWFQFVVCVHGRSKPRATTASQYACSEYARATAVIRPTIKPKALPPQRTHPGAASGPLLPPRAAPPAPLLSAPSAPPQRAALPHPPSRAL